jgi:hypothetical protein
MHRIDLESFFRTKKKICKDLKRNLAASTIYLPINASPAALDSQGCNNWNL